MKPLIIISSFLFFSTEPDYTEIFKYEYPAAIDMLKQNIESFNNTCSTYNIDTAIAISVVFPEFIRYSNYKDILETHSLEIIYVNLGKEYIDFSVGLMQMKPSFVENLERYIKTSLQLSKKYKFITIFNSGTEKQIRQQRLNRLKSTQWQLIYLCTFCDIISERFYQISFDSKSDKIKFYAAAYNYNFLASAEKIKFQINQCNFPYGKNWTMPQYSYSNVASHFYRNYYSTF